MADREGRGRPIAGPAMTDYSILMFAALMRLPMFS